MVFSKIAAAVVVAALCLFFGAYGQVKEGVEGSGAVDLTAGGLQVGDSVPDVLVSGVHNYRDASGKEVGEFRLSDFRGKLVLLDFWATWCAPCVGMMPRLDSLQGRFSGRVAIVSVSYQGAQEVLPFLKKLGRGSALPKVLGSKVLHELFPHRYLPHFVWIDGSGVVRAITGNSEVTAENIEKMLGSPVAMEAKKDMYLAYDPGRPLFFAGNGGNGEGLKYHSLLSGYVEGLPSGYGWSLGAMPKVNVRNMSMLRLFRLAYGGEERYLSRYRVVNNLSGGDRFSTSLSGRAYMDWLKSGFGYCYELVLPERMADDLFSVMRGDLGRMFPDVSARVELRKVKCMVLKRIGPGKAFATLGEDRHDRFSPVRVDMRNSSFKVLCARLEILYMQHIPYPIVDGTGFKGNVDLVLDAKLSDLDAVNRELGAYGLKLEADDFVTYMLLLSDGKKGGAK